MTTFSSRFALQPQRRRKGKGWMPCQPHQAKRWAVIRRPSGEVLFHSPGKAAASSELRRIERHVSGGKKSSSPKPGSRWSDAAPAVSSGRTIATSLSQEQFLAQAERKST